MGIALTDAEVLAACRGAAQDYANGRPVADVFEELLIYLLVESADGEEGVA